MICRHGFRRHECLAPACENATPRTWPKVRPSAGRERAPKDQDHARRQSAAQPDAKAGPK